MSIQAFPLCAAFDAGAPIGLRGIEAIAVGRLLGVATALAKRLPQGGYCINACEDRLNFLAAFAAAMIARSVTLLPQNRVPHVLRELVRSHAGACRITDDDEAWEEGENFSVGAWPSTAARLNVPAFAPGQVAVILFTSGTTGTPRPHAKTWGSLVAGARALRARIGLSAGATIVGAVPPQHMWGLETTVMLPLQSGCAVDATCPLLPAEIAASLERCQGARWLVATPAHLRACALAGTELPRLTGVLSSTAQLPEETARSIEERCAAPLYEIYGSTETGAIATRRTARTQEYEPVDGIGIAFSATRAVAGSGHLDSQVTLNDMLEPRGDGRFAVLGREGDLVKIAGKRGSLAALSAELNRIPGVLDAVFWLPGTNSTQRLMAFVVAPGMAREDLLGNLRERIDPVFLPRPLLLVQALPRNATGKLSHESLAALAAGRRVPGVKLGPDTDDWQSVPVSHPAIPGHFPGRPIVPGVWLLALVEHALQTHFNSALTVVGAPDVRFREPVNPGEQFRIVLDRIADDKVKFRIEGRASLIADGAFLVGAAS
jgi:acyl-coenzyme A synthetase/AMP-(fatty) acid ligase